MTRIFTPTQLSLYSNSEIAAWWEELEQRDLFKEKLPKATELEIRLQEEGDKHEKQLLKFFIQEGKSVGCITIGVAEYSINMKMKNYDDILKKEEYIERLKQSREILWSAQPDYVINSLRELPLLITYQK